MRKAMIVLLVAIIGVLALGVGPTSAQDRPVENPCIWPNCNYTAHYSEGQLRFVKLASYLYHLNSSDVPTTGVSVLAFFLKLGPHPDQHPVHLTRSANHSRRWATSTFYGTTEMQQDMASVSHYLALNPDDTHYVGGIFMGYLAATACNRKVQLAAKLGGGEPARVPKVCREWTERGPWFF